MDLAPVVPEHRAFGEDVRLCRGGFEGFADYLFGVAEAVDGCGVDPVDAEIDGAVDGCDRVGVVLRSPCEGPVSATDGPCSEADRRQMQVRVSQLLRFHVAPSCLLLVIHTHPPPGVPSRKALQFNNLSK